MPRVTAQSRPDQVPTIGARRKIGARLGFDGAIGVAQSGPERGPTARGPMAKSGPERGPTVQSGPDGAIGARAGPTVQSGPAWGPMVPWRKRAPTTPATHIIAERRLSLGCVPYKCI